MKLFREIINKFKHAIDGIKIGSEDKAVRLQIMISFCVIIITLFLNFNLYEWIYVIVSCFLVIALEMLNTAIEQITNVLFSNYDERAKKIKDLSAGSVLVISVGVLIGYLFILKGKWI